MCCEYLCQVILKTLQRFKCYGADTKCRLFKIRPLSVTLTVGVVTQLMRSGYRLIMVITCAMLYQKIFCGLKVTERTRKCYGRTDGLTNGHPIRALGKGINTIMTELWRYLIDLQDMFNNPTKYWTYNNKPPDAY